MFVWITQWYHQLMFLTFSIKKCLRSLRVIYRRKMLINFRFKRFRRKWIFWNLTCFCVNLWRTIWWLIKRPYWKWTISKSLDFVFMPQEHYQWMNQEMNISSQDYPLWILIKIHHFPFVSSMKSISQRRKSKNNSIIIKILNKSWEKRQCSDIKHFWDYISNQDFSSIDFYWNIISKTSNYQNNWKCFIFK